MHIVIMKHATRDLIQMALKQRLVLDLVMKSYLCSFRRTFNTFSVVVGFGIHIILTVFNSFMHKTTLVEMIVTNSQIRDKNTP